MIHLYACAISATNGYRTVITSIGVKANSKNEAIGMALEHAREVFPISDYHHHQVSIVQFSDEFILDAASHL